MHLNPLNSCLSSKSSTLQIGAMGNKTLFFFCFFFPEFDVRPCTYCKFYIFLKKIYPGSNTWHLLKKISRDLSVTISQSVPIALKTLKCLQCSHSFCHECLKNHILSLCHSKESPVGISCSLCRDFIPAANISAELKDWANEFPTNDKLGEISQSSQETFVMAVKEMKMKRKQSSLV